MVSVVLCARNSAATLERQLAALARQDIDGPFEVIVVDNASTDDTVAIAQRWSNRLRLRILSEPLRGVNRARNRGVQSCRAEFIALCDSDDEVDERWLRALCVALEHHDIVGGRIEHRALSDPRAAFRDDPQSESLPSAMGVPYAMGANLAFRRQVFDAVGGFDPRFDIGCDDVDFCLRAHHNGYAIRFVADAVVFYRNKHRLGAVIRQRFSYGRGDERLARRHGELGFTTYSTMQRVRVVAIRSARLVRNLGEAFDPRTRAAYIAGWAFSAGLVYELLTGRVSDGDHAHG